MGIPRGALLPRILGIPIVSQRAVLKAEDFCVSRGYARTSHCIGGICRHPTYGIAGSLKKFYFPQVADITRARTYVVKSQESVKLTDELLSYAEFLEIMGSLTDNIASKAVFYIADSDSNGRVSQTEYIKFMRKSEKIKSWPEDEVYSAYFHVSDDDGNGFLSIDEFARNMEQM